MIQCNRLVFGVQYPGISSISAFVRKSGHEFVLFDTANYFDDKVSNIDRHHKVIKSSIDLEFRQVKNKEKLHRGKPIRNLLTDLEVAITKQNKIDIIGVSCFSEDWPFALFLIRKVRCILPDVLIVVGGVHASIMPEQVIMHSEVNMVCVGEGELPIVELLDSIDSGEVDLAIQNLWIKCKNKTIRNSQRTLLQFENDFPMLDWTDYNDFHFMYPFEGRLYRRGSVFIGRGCPYSCKFCVNFLMNTSSNRNGQLPYKDVELIIKEIGYLKDEYNLEFLRFWDETFLAKPKEYLLEFARAYKNEIDMPFTVETTAQTINHDNVRMLVGMGCQSVSIGVETSNEKLRMEILGKRITNEVFDKCFEIITEYGLRKVANFMFFLPHQTLDDMWNDVYSSARWKIDHPSVRIFYPYVGTALREYCIKHDLIDLDLVRRMENEEAIHDISGLSNEFVTFQDTVLYFDAKVKEQAMRILDNFILFQETQPSRHQYLTQLLDRNNIDSKMALRKIECEIYKKRFGTDYIKRMERYCVSDGLSLGLKT